MMVVLDDETMSIGMLSERSGASVRALRYYEQHGLLAAERTRTGHRRFAPDAVEDVRRIRVFLEAGFPLAVISRVMPCFVDEGARLHACVADYLREHIDAVRERMEALGAQRESTEKLQQLIVT